MGVNGNKGGAGYCAALLLFVSGCSDETLPVEPADVVFRNGTIHTVSAAGAGAVAVRGDSIVYVGDPAGAEAMIGPATDVVDLEGRMLMPGIVDAHVHPMWGALEALYKCNFPFSATPDDIREAVAACVDAQPDSGWITGGRWDSGFFENYDVASPRAWLDAVSGNAAVYLSDDSGHNGWANSKALEIAGITADTPDPPGGSIARDADGNPNGVLLESAQGLVGDHIPDESPKQGREAARFMAKTLNAFGITAAKPAAIRERHIAALAAADRDGELSVHIAAAIRTPYGRREAPLDYDDIDRIRDAHASANVDTRFVKIFLDGVPTPARTAAMLAPYVADDAHGSDFTGGPLHVDKALLAQDLVELERRGYTVKIHTAGDRAVRDALDAIGEARDENGTTGLRHELSHAGYVDPADLPRFAELGVVADLSPVIWHPSPIIDAVIAAVGPERGHRYWPVRDLIDAGAPLLAGSDWPSAVPDANPWVGIEAFVTRADPRGETPGTLWPEQAITLVEAIRIYTLDGARALRIDDRVGSIEVGKRADLIVLDRDLTSIPIDDVGDTRVEQTWFRGELVYEFIPEVRMQ